MYGEGRNWRYIIGFGLLIALLIVVIILIVNHGGNSKKVPETQRALTSYVNDPDVSVSETIIGPITAPQTHNEVQISVSNQTASFQLYQGYDGNVISSRDYQMSPAAFKELLNALDKAGFTEGSTDAKLKNDQGYCPSGQRYVYQIKQGATSVERFWATTCKGTKTYKGNFGQTMDLFQSQIPDYDDLTQDTNFSSGLIGL